MEQNALLAHQKSQEILNNLTFDNSQGIEKELDFGRSSYLQIFPSSPARIIQPRSRAYLR